MYANKDIAAARVENWSRIPWRRIAENIELDPFTPPEQLAALLPMLKVGGCTRRMQSILSLIAHGFNPWNLPYT